MNPRRPACSKCLKPLSETWLKPEQVVQCSNCEATLWVAAFPALDRPQARGKTAETIVVEGEASCFFHPAKRAVISCEACGRFLCQLCDLDLNGRHFCPTCLEAHRQIGDKPELTNYRVTYDTAALTLALASTFLGCIFYLWILTGLTIIILAITSFRKPSSIVPRTRLRAIIALILGVLQIAVWIGIVVPSLLNF